MIRNVLIKKKTERNPIHGKIGWSHPIRLLSRHLRFFLMIIWWDSSFYCVPLMKSAFFFIVCRNITFFSDRLTKLAIFFRDQPIKFTIFFALFWRIYNIFTWSFIEICEWKRLTKFGIICAIIWRNSWFF